jgi:hypothetical protein
MGISKEYRAENFTPEEPVKTAVWVCPACGKTVHLSRSYCDCHAGLFRAKALLSESSPQIGRCNHESSRVNCNDCPENCDWCASFGRPEKNPRGFGGKTCAYRSKTARCNCCQEEIKLDVYLQQTNLQEIIKPVSLKTLKAMSAVIQEALDKPVLARILQAKTTQTEALR